MSPRLDLNWQYDLAPTLNELAAFFRWTVKETCKWEQSTKDIYRGLLASRYNSRDRRSEYIYSAHRFFHDFDFTPVATDDNGFHFLDTVEAQVADLKFHGMLPQFSPNFFLPINGAEDSIQGTLAYFLQQSGRPATERKYIPSGVVDIFIDETPPTIIEMKITFSPSDAREVVQQLKRYAQDFENPILGMGARPPLSPRIEQYLESEGIIPYPVEFRFTVADYHKRKQNTNLVDQKE